MADQKQIKERITATEKTYSITNAMNMVSTSKLRRSEKSLRQFRPISDEIKRTMLSVLSSSSEISHKALMKNDAKPCYIIIASDRGLIGNYNNALFKHFEEYVRNNHKSTDEFYVATIGFKAFSFARKRKYHMVNDENVAIRDDILFADFEEVSNKIYESYIEGNVGRTIVFYTTFINTITSRITYSQVLPIELSSAERAKAENLDYIFEPSKEEILDQIVGLYVNYSLYRILLEAKTSEHASRMNAMKNAKDNAKEIEAKLVLEYNHARQNQITTELIDIINGSNAVN